MAVFAASVAAIAVTVVVVAVTTAVAAAAYNTSPDEHRFHLVEAFVQKDIPDILFASCNRYECLCLYFYVCFVFFAKGAEMTLHCFGVPMAVAIILAEREVAVLLRLCAFLESWLLKGFYISL